jgi:PAS domain S-box-containing protein
MSAPTSTSSPPSLLASFQPGHVFDASPNAYMVLDRQLRFVAANRAYCELTGSQLDELVGKHVIDQFPHDSSNPGNDNARLLRTSFEKVLATGEIDALALIRYSVQRHPGGPLEDRFWSATHTPIFESGRVAFILQHTVDVTQIEQLKATALGATPPPTIGAAGSFAAMAAGLLGRAELVQQANVSLDDRIARLHRLFDQAPGFTAVLSGPDHVFELTNPAYRRLIGNRDVIGLGVRDALPDIAGQGLYELLDRVYATGEVFVGRAIPVSLQTRPDGPVVETILDFVYQPILDVAGQVAGIFVQGNDITDQERAEREKAKLADERADLLQAEQAARAEAERANRLKDEFLATVSHELRTPLTAILGWLELYRGAMNDESRRGRAVDTIERNARALRQLVDDLLDVSRIMSGKMQLEVASVVVASAVEAAIEAVRPAAMAKTIRIQSTLDSKATVMGDAQRIQQIVWNLVSNAVKFTPKSGRVRIVVERRESSIAIEVSDNGQGLAPEFLPHVFDRFRQAEPGSARRHGGLGLGLAIAKHLVELHGGTITADSVGVGEGATFTVLLPTALARSTPTAAFSSPSIDVPQEIVGLRILVVEDESDTRDLLNELLTGYGAIVTAAPSVAEGQKAFLTAVPDLVISDIGMPAQDGYTFVRWLRSLPDDSGGRVPAIALTAFARTEDRTAALRAGFRAHIPKPLDVAELLAVIASLVPSATRPV